MTCQVTIVISTLRCGGAERVATTLANGLRARGFDMSVVTLAGAEEPFYPLSEEVRLVALGLLRESRSTLQAVVMNSRRVLALSRALTDLKPDVLIAFMPEANAVAVTAGRIVRRLPCRIVLSERIYPAFHRHLPVWRLARRMTYPLADALVPCAVGMKEWFAKWLPPEKIVPIQNPVSLEGHAADPDAQKLARRMKRQKWLVAMGRLVEQKGYDLLLDAFARIPPEAREGWHLGIIGEGPLANELAHQIDSLGLRDQAQLLGRFSNPMPLLKAARAYVLSSRLEGFPNALTEAMACGLPAVAFDCLTGPGEIIRDGVDGLLVPAEDVGALSEALSRIMQDDGLRDRLAARAPEVLDRFGEARFLDAWQRLIERLTSAR